VLCYGRDVIKFRPLNGIHFMQTTTESLIRFSISRVATKYIKISVQIFFHLLEFYALNSAQKTK